MVGPNGGAHTPLINAESISRRPSAPICITDHAEAIPAIAALLPSHAPIAWEGGSDAIAQTNWAMTAGASCLLWPSRDLPRLAYDLITAALKAAGARTVTLAKLATDDPDDAVDALGRGWDEQTTAEWLAAQGIGEPHAPDYLQIPEADDVQGLNPGIVTRETIEEAVAKATDCSLVDRWIDWGLDLDAKGKPVTNMNNAARILEKDPALKGSVVFDEFHQRIYTGNPSHEFGDADLAYLQRYMQSNIGIARMSSEAIKSAIVNIAHLHTRNVVRDWFDTLKFDGIERISHFFPDYFGTPETAYSTAVSRNFWLSMAARVYKPGCKVDNMVILEGKQGAGKSHALHIIGGDWYAEQNTSVRDPQKFAENIQGKLIMEIGEMDSFHGAEMTRVKQTVTCTSDRYRDSYGHYARDHPRQGIFCGTTNADDWNRDPTGARRFWPIVCLGQINLAGIAHVREQCFAEAVAAFKANEKWWLMPEDETEREQRDRFYEDPWDVRIDNIVATLEDVATSEVLSFIGIPPEKQTKADQMRIARRLTFLKWERKNTRDGNRVLKRYYNPDK